ncbi:type IV secretion system DNA-binding domain-containing protein [Candidatus Gottesmanbacteria bacterium]|nr:type IV secretion system DNA-binding domain-containing protein [Candidatus Gottesmanbacteria bacterium]
MIKSSFRHGSNTELGKKLAENEHVKLEKPIYQTTIRCLAAAHNKSEFLVTSVASLFKILDNPDLNTFKLWRKNRKHVLIDYQLRKLGPKKFTLNVQELATLYHLPTIDAPIAQVSQTSSKKSEPPINLPAAPDVIPFAVTTFRGVEKEFGIKREDRRRHLYIIGKTGVGKSKLIELLALADIRQNKGCVVMDPHGDLAEELLRYIPRDRLYDVIYFNPADTEHPVSFNPLEGSGSYEFRQNIVAGFIAIFKKLFSFTWNQRLEHVLRYTTLALLDIPNSTVLGITKMLSDTRYRQAVVAQIKDPMVKKFWTTEFSSWNDQYAGEAVTPIINKVGQFVASPVIRNIVGQQKSIIKLDEIINQGKILIANFAIGKLGEENSALLGAMFITKLWEAAIARANLPEHERKDTYLYVDEFQNFATSAFAQILSEARKYRLNLTVAHQYMAQLPPEVRSTIFGNVGSIVSFRIGGEDAVVLTKEYTPTFAEEDFMRLDMRNFYVKMAIDGQVAVPFSGRTVEFPAPDEDFKQDVIKISRERWARPRGLVEKEIAEFENTVTPQSTSEKPSEFSEPII